MPGQFRITCLAVWLCVSSSCSLMPRWAHPSQLWKLNRHQPWDEGSFSIPDPAESHAGASLPAERDASAVNGLQP